MPNESTSPSPADHPSSSTPTFKQLSRVPLIPERILRKYGAYCSFDNRFRALARLLQCLWLRDHDIPTAASINESASSNSDQTNASGHNPPTAFGSILSPEAANAGRTFLSPAIHRIALQEWLMCEDGACIDEERLFSNALSSMPLVFNLFGPLLNLDLASAVFQRLLPGFVRKVVRFQFETAPLGRRNEKGLSDRTAFDVAVHTIDADGEPGIVFIECKFSETLDNEPARMRERYNEASREVRLYTNPDSLILRAGPINQLWREGMLAQLAVDHGVAPKAVFLAIGPELNRRVQAAFRVYQGELINADQQDASRVPFVPLTLETVIEAIAAAGAIDHARALWDRYCDFDRVYRLVMQELTGDIVPASAEKSVQESQKRALPPGRRAFASTNARRTRAASSRKRSSSETTKQGAA